MRKGLVICIFIITALSLFAGVTEISAEESDYFITQARTIEFEQHGISNPAGLAFSARTGDFFVVGGVDLGQRPPNSFDILSLNQIGDQKGLSRISAAVEDPINMTYDGHRERLLIYQHQANIIIEVKADSKGELDPGRVIRHDVSHFEIVHPQGMSVDPHSGTLYILDAAGPRIVIIEADQGGVFSNAIVSEMNLEINGLNSGRGLAFDASTGYLYLISLGEQELYQVNLEGLVLAEYDLSKFGLVEPQGMVFAPSGDRTDDPSEMNLYLADSGYSGLDVVEAGPGLSGEFKNQEISNGYEFRKPGQVVELSFEEPIQLPAPSYDSEIVNIFDLSSPPFEPPSTDPSGLTYLSSTDTLVIVDGEVEETIDGITHFEGVNVWETTLDASVVYTTNISTVAPTAAPITDEPTGITFNPTNGHYYITDDGDNKIYDLDPGLDGQIGTADDSWTSFDTHPSNNDPEGIAYDPNADVLYVAGGFAREIFIYSTSGTHLGNFDVEKYGIVDSEGVEYIAESDTLIIVDRNTPSQWIETTTAGVLLRWSDLFDLFIRNPAGLVYAPASDGSGDWNFYITDRGFYTELFPEEVDGKLYEITAPDPITPGNQLPIVDAGPDQTISLPTNSTQLAGSASDDGIPDPPGSLTTTWSQVYGPCQAVFTDTNVVTSTVSFQYPGRYDLRLVANDGELTPYDVTTITVTKNLSQNAFELLIADIYDDAEELASGQIVTTGKDLDLVNSGTDQQVGLRFNWIDLPAGVSITNAYIQFTVDEADSEETNLFIHGEDVDDAAAFWININDISSRTKTTASVSWNPEPWLVVGESGPDQRTPNLASLIQEIIERPGWTSGNSIVFIITGTGKRTADSFDKNPCTAPLLHIEYIEGPNTPPTAGDDGYTTDEDVTLNVAAPGVLTNDSDVDGSPLTAVLDSNPISGTLTLNTDGSFEYVPNPDFYGVDSFTYMANDGLSNSLVATATITVTAQNDPPVALLDAYETDEDTVLNVGVPGVLWNDTDKDSENLSAILETDSISGTLDLNVDGSFVYTPDANFHGIDAFEYKAYDGQYYSDAVSVTITVNAVNDPPDGEEDSYSTDEDQSLNVGTPGVLGNDTDLEGDDLSAVLDTDPISGTLTLNSDGSFQYIPDADFYGEDIFTYQAFDGVDYSDIVSVTVTVNPIEDDPVAVYDSYTTRLNTELNVTTPGVLENDYDVDGDLLFAELVSGPTNGILSFHIDGSFVYDPNPGFIGYDSFTYKAYDGKNYSNTILVDIEVYVNIYLPFMVK
jgi:hypothetical protein